VQISVENIQSRAIAGELDTADIAGTDIRLMNYSYVNTSSSKDRKTRYEISALDDNEAQDNINEFRMETFIKYDSARCNCTPCTRELLYIYFIIVPC
jgi:hypothetical protein